MSLVSLKDGYRALVFGATGGVGAALVQRLAGDARCGEVFAGARRAGGAHGKVRTVAFDLMDEASIAAAVAAASEGGALDLVIVATGVLHDAQLQPEKTMRTLSAGALMRSFHLNAIGPALIAKHAASALPRDRKSVFAALSARVGSISDNRSGGWHAYRASKAALNQLIHTCAIEASMRNTQAVFALLHPGTVDTGMSKPFQAGVAPNKLFSPDVSAAHLMRVIDQLDATQSGGFFAWDGTPIPF